ncbi:MAG: MarR family winged helix-turn-helix transcriptional regulator [Armatimonadota bacterium]|nr:MarR family winged helix-turn-helix transcriptional regulator [Armatimonadota bacterium]MDR5697389.1 MarR family winged helix-turn-helix transcriptional regulator [Armatimonadota bacterium]
MQRTGSGRGHGPFDNGGAHTGQRVVQGLLKVAMALRHAAWQYAQPRALTPTQSQILSYLRFGAAGGARLSEVADALAVTRATASEAVSALVHKGLIRKARHVRDRRSRVVTLTEAGRREADRAAAWPEFLLQAVRTLTPPEQAAFLRALVKTIRHLQDRGQIPVSRMCLTCRFFRPYVHPDPRRPHHCAFVDAPFGDAHLRVDCPDHETADAVRRRQLWVAFTRVSTRS